MLIIREISPKNMKKTTFLIVGKHAVLEALKNPSRKIERVFLTEDAQKKLNRENQSLNLFKKINVFYKSRRELDNLCGRDETAHQGLVAEVEQLEEITLKEFIIENTNNNLNSNYPKQNSLLYLLLIYYTHQPNRKIMPQSRSESQLFDDIYTNHLSD